MSGGPLNLSKRQSFDRSEMEMPPLLPIRQLKHYFQVDQHRRETLGSTGSGCEGETSSTETSPNAKDVSDVFAEGVKIYNRNGTLVLKKSESESETEMKFVGEQKISCMKNSGGKRVTGFEGLLSISEAIKLQKQQEGDIKSLKRASEVFQPRPPEVSESSYCPHLSTATLPPLTLTDHTNDQVKNVKSKIRLYL